MLQEKGFDDEPGALEIRNDFWDFFSQLVALVWHTQPEERLGVVPRLLEERYGKVRPNVYERIEAHVLRTVAWMERFKDAEVLSDVDPDEIP